MTVAELIEFLGGLDQEAIVVLSSDGEGNSYSPLADSYSLGYYFPDSTWSGEFTSDDALIDRYDLDEGEEDYAIEYVKAEEGVQRAICLWPIN